MNRFIGINYWAGIGEFQRSKTHCPKGHIYDEINTRKDTHHRTCRECARLRSQRQRSTLEGRLLANERCRQSDRRHSDRKLRTNLRRHHETRQWLESQKPACITCGEMCVACLEFHHRNPGEKSFAISTATRHAKAKLRIEIAKCDVLCANCHRKLHYQAKSGNYASRLAA